VFGMDWRTSELRSKPRHRPVPEEIPDADHELVMERVCAIDVAKASGVVCVRTRREHGESARCGTWSPPPARSATWPVS